MNTSRYTVAPKFIPGAENMSIDSEPTKYEFYSSEGVNLIVDALNAAKAKHIVEGLAVITAHDFNKFDSATIIPFISRVRPCEDMSWMDWSLWNAGGAV